jgi:hypothetical protein
MSTSLPIGTVASNALYSPPSFSRGHGYQRLHLPYFPHYRARLTASCLFLRLCVNPYHDHTIPSRENPPHFPNTTPSLPFPSPVPREPVVSSLLSLLTFFPFRSFQPPPYIPPTRSKGPTSPPAVDQVLPRTHCAADDRCGTRTNHTVSGEHEVQHIRDVSFSYFSFSLAPCWGAGL